MAQLVSALFFSVVTIAAIASIVGMVRGEWRRVASVLSGSELVAARAAAPQTPVKKRGWTQEERRLSPMASRAAAA